MKEYRTTLQSLETPELILDTEKLSRNISRMERHLSSCKVPLRPHGKTAKSMEVMRRFGGMQQHGITVSTVKEAEYYFAGGIRDIIYAVGIAPDKLPRIFSLISRGAEITVILDSLAQAEAAAEEAKSAGVSLPVLIELDADGSRSGIAPEDLLLIRLGSYIHNASCLEMQGILTHAGSSYFSGSIDEIKRAAELERLQAVSASVKLKEAEIPCPVVSVGSTPTAAFGTSFQGVTEVRAGVFIFQDLVMAGIGVCTPEQIALSILTTVIGHKHDKQRIITDSGWTALSRDRGTAVQAVDQGYGVVCDITGGVIGDLIVSAASQEHGIITRRSGGRIDMECFPVGRKLRILPNHACATAACFDRYTLTDHTLAVTGRWERINGWR